MQEKRQRDGNGVTGMLPYYHTRRGMFPPSEGKGNRRVIFIGEMRSE